MPEIPENFDEAADGGLRLTTCSRSSFRTWWESEKCVIDRDKWAEEHAYIQGWDDCEEIAMTREAAIIQFCEVEMGWEFFRAEFQIGDNPSKSLENAMKLRKFLSENAEPMRGQPMK
jgi:hypothetical protein